jgi:hypothetical protein
LTVQTPLVPNGYYLLSVMTNALHGGQMVRVDGPPLAAPTVTSPEGIIPRSMPDIGGTAEPGSTVVMRLDGKVSGTARADTQGRWSFTPGTALVDGDHRVVAFTTDAVGNVSPDSEERSFTVNTQEPRSHYGWDCTVAPSLPAIWALVALVLSLSRRYRAR